jgi:hypothetical protein
MLAGTTIPETPHGSTISWEGLGIVYLGDGDLLAPLFVQVELVVTSTSD